MKKDKKGLLIVGLIAFCVILAAVIYMLGQSPKGEDTPTDTGGIVQDVTPSGIDGSEETNAPEIKPDPIVPSEPSGTGQNGTDIELIDIKDKPEPPDKPDTAAGDDEDEPHEIPTDPVLTDPAQKPSSDPKPSEPPAQNNSTPNAGDKKDGKVYIPGFGWVDDEGGGSVVGDSGSDGDWDKIIGH